MTTTLLIFGASVRAAAFSALRAGLRPWCADLFADADLQARCPVRALNPEQYPGEFITLATQAPSGPWMYTGALENYRSLVRELTRRRPLWGNNVTILNHVRSPAALPSILPAAQIPCPAIYSPHVETPPEGRWLRKPVMSAGGHSICFWDVTQAIDL